MFFTHLLLALVIGLLFAAIFPMGMRGYRGGYAFLIFFLLLFFATWAGGVWLTPIGYAYPWFVFLLIGLFLALFIAALLPPAPPPRKKQKEPGTEPTASEAATIVTVNAFFWILLIGLMIAIILGYFFR
jgi:hypothetical protein